MVLNNGMGCYIGLLFLKPKRKQVLSENVGKVAIEQQAYECARKASEFGVMCNHALEDDEYSREPNRPEISDLFDYLATGRYEVLVVEDIYNLTTDLEELKSIIDKLHKAGIAILDLRAMAIRFNNYDEEC